MWWIKSHLHPFTQIEYLWGMKFQIPLEFGWKGYPAGWKDIYGYLLGGFKVRGKIIPKGCTCQGISDAVNLLCTIWDYESQEFFAPHWVDSAVHLPRVTLKHHPNHWPRIRVILSPTNPAFLGLGKSPVGRFQPCWSLLVGPQERICATQQGLDQGAWWMMVNLENNMSL
jgi:hypothetical protein